MRDAKWIAILYVCIASGYAQHSDTCGLGRFRCHNGKCIAGDLLCDGKSDCSDSSDERLPQCNNNQPGRKCGFDQFPCDNKQCIDGLDVCDGIRNCLDGSDETSATCGSLPCTAFRCAYGACIDSNLKCNNVSNCADGSDEAPVLCKGWSTPELPIPWIWNFETSTPRPITIPTRPLPITEPTTSTQSSPTLIPWIWYSGTTCIAPPQPQNGHWRLHERLCAGRRNCNVSEGTDLPSASYLIYSCNEGHRLNGSHNVICNFEGKWPNIPECIEIRCEGLNTVFTEATCTYRGDRVPCDSSVLPRTRATVRCRNSYQRESDRQSESVMCNDIGNWDPEPIQCVPACGRLPNKEIPLIFGGYLPNITNFPWHASLYRGESKEYICGASIIKKNLLITAAHCVYDEPNRRIVEATGIYIAAGNIYRDYDFPLHNENIVQKRQAKNIYMCYFIGKKGNYGSDIAILEINRPFELSAYLVPICIDLFSDLPTIKHGDVGKVAGFGRATTTGNTSMILQALSVPYVSIDQCMSAAKRYGTEQFVVLPDKFCAGFTNGSSVCDGDSGSGLVFLINNSWYLHGIVSTALDVIQEGQQLRCNNYLYAVFTKISSHIFFIQNVMLKVERREQPTCTDRGVVT